MLTLLAPAAGAQAPPAATSPRKIVISGSVRSRLEMWSWFEPDTADHQYAYSGNHIRLSLSQQREGWDWRAELAAPALLGLPDNAVAPGVQGALGLGANYFTSNHRKRNTGMIFPKQLYVRFTRFGASRSHALKIGRFEFIDGSEVVPKSPTLATVKRDRIYQRIVGPFAFTHVMRSFDGLHHVYEKGRNNVTMVAAVPTRGVFQVDGWGWIKTALGYGSFTRTWGAGRHSADTRLMGIYYHDWRPLAKIDNRPAAARAADLGSVRIGTFGGHSLHEFVSKAGTADFMVWGVGQTGRWGAQNHRAGAFDVEAGFQPKVLPKLKPWFRGGYFWSSGDDTPGDGTHSTFYQLLPTPRPYARTPFFNLMNNHDRMAMLILRPHPKVTWSGEYHGLRLTTGNDLWYLGGGAFQPWSFGFPGRATPRSKSLANLYDSSLEVRPRPDLALTFYYGHVQGLSAAAAIYPRGKDANFGYIEALYRF